MARRKYSLTALLALLPLLASAASIGDFNGVWQIRQPVSELKTTEGSEPPLLPEARRIYQQRIALHAAGDQSYDATLRCKPMGEPRTGYDPSAGPFEILVNPKVLVFAYTWNRMIRFVYISNDPVDPVGPTYYGTANGRWQGSALLIDAADFNETTLLDQAGMPHSEQLRLTERFRLRRGGTQLEEVLRFEDPLTFSAPWETRLIYQRQNNKQIAEDVCIERLGITDY